MNNYDSDDEYGGGYNSDEYGGGYNSGDENYRYNHKSDDEDYSYGGEPAPSYIPIPSEYKFADPENEFRNEYNYQDRVGGYLDNAILAGVHRKGRQSTFDPQQKFVNIVASMAKEMTDVNIIQIRNEIPSMLSFIPDFKHTRYKNPTAFVLGYWVSRNTKTRVDEKALNHVKKKLRLLQYPVRDYDIVRYANLWISTIWSTFKENEEDDEENDEDEE